jgi:hypothetical protein
MIGHLSGSYSRLGVCEARQVAMAALSVSGQHAVLLGSTWTLDDIFV